jgi:hypothetical protein
MMTLRPIMKRVCRMKIRRRLTSGVFLLLYPVSLAAAQSTAPPPSPGLGSSADRPLGQPIDLKLPPGYTLAYIEGGVTLDFFRQCLSAEADVFAAACQFHRGPSAINLNLVFDPEAYVSGQDDNLQWCADPAERLWIGWLSLTSDPQRVQNILVPTEACTTTEGTITPLLFLPPPSERTLTFRRLEVSLTGYCVNGYKTVPDVDHRMEPGVVVEDPGLVTILAAIRGRDLRLDPSQQAIQRGIWDHTEHGQRPTPELLGRLAVLP